MVSGMSDFMCLQGIFCHFDIKYRLLKEAVMKEKSIDFTDQAFLSITIQLKQSTRDCIKSMGGFLSFLTSYAEMLHDDELLDILIPRDRHQEMLNEVAGRSKGITTVVMGEEKGKLVYVKMVAFCA